MDTPEQVVHSESTEHEYAEHPEYSQIIGVFRDPEQATQAMEALKQANFTEDQIRFTEYDPPQAANEVENALLQGVDRRFFVHVEAPGREEEAVDILAHHGANNSDLPRGTELVQGKLTYTRAAAAAAESPSGSDSIASSLGTEHDAVNRLTHEPRMP
jgi:hypothetical protein